MKKTVLLLGKYVCRVYFLKVKLYVYSLLKIIFKILWEDWGKKLGI